MAIVERVLFVHAHPDDETIDTGGTLATLIDRGAQVTVLTCTRGERGEVIPADLKPALESPAALAALRMRELDAAMKILGVTDHRYLGDDTARWSGTAQREYVDSGMRWGKRGAEATGDADSASLVSADFSEMTSDIASVVISVSPDAIVSYDDRGGYGHPDHIRAHDAARRAADVYGVPFYTVLPVASEPSAAGSNPPADSRTVSVDVGPVLDRKRAALGAYRSQLSLDGDTIVFSGGQRQPITTIERYFLVEPRPEQPIAFSDQHPGSRFTVAVLAGIIGVVFGSLLSVYNQSTTLIAGQPIWIGPIVAILVTAGLFAGLRLAFGSRIVTGFAAVPMIVIVGLLSILSAGGSEIVPWNGPGILWQLSPTIIGLAVILWPNRRSRERRNSPARIT
jgi:N-acetyl-1-D-myo-inositol-2-amino-2-deoxy-alpha-D-glucopyranoside deacetylase